ncbi:MAG: aminotransferase class V-fold PLP-dependent enzyme [Acidobacteriaceae bacterium]|nr:aminotransferase class V-fold PLP-dependent enzyme [Acidobacteriaceae bacterium]
MTARRDFLKSAFRSAAAVPLLTSLGVSADAAQQTGSSLPHADNPDYWARVRDQFLLARDKVFFNNGTIGAMPKVVLDRVVAHLHTMATDLADWDYKGPNWIGGYDSFTDIRAKAARLVNADVKEVALTENVTESMSFVANGLDLKPGDEILISDQEHPGGRSSWLLAEKRHGAVVRMVKLPRPAHSQAEIFDIVAKSITPRTRVIAISHVITVSGAIVPAKQIADEAQRRGIFTVFDGAQALGHIPVDVREIGCDAYVSCFHKWLLAPAGNGFLYVRRDAAPHIWSTLASTNWDNHEDDGYRFSQRGTGSLSLLMGMDAALDFHFEIGPARVQERIKFLGDRLRDGLRENAKVKIFSPSDPALCAGITVYSVEGMNGGKLQEEFWNRGRLRPRSLGEVNGVRQCTHIFNSPEEVDRTVAIVNELTSA